MNRTTTLQRLTFLLLALLVSLTGTPVAASPATTGLATTPAATTRLATTETASFQGVDAIYLTSSSEDETTFQVRSEGYRLEAVAGVDGPCESLAVDGFANGGGAGSPGLPTRSVLVGIPVGATPSLEILSQPVRLPGYHTICPAPDAVTEEADGQVLRYVEQAVAADGEIYSQNSLFPASVAQIIEDGWVGRVRYLRVAVAPFQYNPSDGSLIYYPALQVRVRHTANNVQATRTSEPDDFTQSIQGMLLNGAQAGHWAATSQPSVDAATNSGWMPPSPALRLLVKEEGLYAVTYAELAQAGVPVSSILSHSLRLYLNGQDVALRVVDGNNVDDTDGLFDPGDRVLFYGQGVNEKYTDTNVYWLTYGATGGLHMVDQGVATTGEAVGSYRETVRFEENFNYVSSTPKLPDFDHWYGRLLTIAGSNAAGSWRVPFNTSVLASGQYSATVQAAIVSRTRGTHHVNLYVNEVYVGDNQWQDATYQTLSIDFDQSLLQPDNNIIRLELINDLNGQSVSVVYMDWLALSYQRQTVAMDKSLIFDSPGPGNWRIGVQGLANDPVEAYDVTNPLRVRKIPVSAGTKVEFGVAGTEPHRYLVQNISQRKRVAAIEKAGTADLLATDKRVNYLIITYHDFLDAVQPLADYRSDRGLSVEVVDVQHIYDVFNYGRMSPNAIRDFLTYAFWNWQTSYVLLVGDGTFDPRNYRNNSAQTFIPPYLAMVDPDLGETAADNRYVAIIGSDPMPDMYLGRLPAESSADVTTMVDKIIDYESAPAGSGWNKNVLFVSDDLKGGGGAFYNYSDAIADGVSAYEGEMVPLLPDIYNKKKLYLPYDCADGNSCRDDIISQINQGALLISYVGHSAKEYWAEEKLLDIDSVNQLNNQFYPVMLPMTCLEGYFHEAQVGRMSLSEALVRKAGGGAIASWSSSGLGLASGHDYLERGFFISIFYNNLREIGAAANFGKLYLSIYSPAGKYDDLMETFSLLGDPALRLRTIDSVPEQRAHDLFLPSVTR